MSSARKCMPYMLILLIFSHYVFVMFCEEISIDSACKTMGTTKCSVCISILPECAWCTQENFTDTTEDRCDTLSNLIMKGCESEKIISPDHEQTLIKNVDVKNGDADGPAVQIQPQHIKVRLRRNKPHNFNVTFRVAEDHPVDLYFLLDLTVTMEDEKGMLAALASKIAEKVEAITKNYQFGFGSFLDKVTLPFTMTNTATLNHPCRSVHLLNSSTCEPSYGFKHRLTLVKNQTQFVNMVRDAPLSANLDKPEGGLDAIMQVVVCGDKIGWRNNARKLLIYSSDATFHIAGDGKLAGIVIPNDGRCHMGADNRYSAELDQDYPSVAQLARKVFQNSVNIIFAVPDQNIEIYTALSKEIKGSKANKLEGDSSNIVQIIDDFYKNITSSVELRHTGGNGIITDFRSKCIDGHTSTQTYSCDGLKIGQSVIFDIELQASECPAKPEDRFQTIEITPVGIPEKLVVDVEIVCECPCEESGNKETNSPICTNGNGTYACGVCVCNKYRYGELCQCDIGESSDKTCISDESKSGLPCSGRGKCLCGECMCSNRRYRGQYCECDDMSCEYDNGKLCGGPTQGQCFCGKCKCREGFEGDNCGCPTSITSCLFDSQDEVCYGHGECVCGECQCHDKYRQPSCRDCPTCGALCDEKLACARCTLSGQLDCGMNCQNVTIVDYLDDDNDTMRICFFRIDDGCIRFSYHTEGNDVMMQLLGNKECTTEVDILPIIIGIIVSILLAGIVLLIIWKCLVSAYDTIEYAKFQTEVDNLKWAKEENPLYEKAVQSFNNPVCGQDLDY